MRDSTVATEIRISVLFKLATFDTLIDIQHFNLRALVSAHVEYARRGMRTYLDQNGFAARSRSSQIGQQKRNGIDIQRCIKYAHCTLSRSVSFIYPHTRVNCYTIFFYF